MAQLPPGTPPLEIGHVVATYSPNDYQSVDHIVFTAIVVSCATKRAYILPSVLTFETEKSDNGDAGAFTITFPMAPTYANDAPNPAPGYAKIANPMDVIAIYALRLVSTDEPVAGAPTSVPDVAPTDVVWGEANFISKLIAAGGGGNFGGGDFSGPPGPGVGVAGPPGPFGVGYAGSSAFKNGTCIFVGMVDEARVKAEIGSQPSAHLMLTGHDLTKVFMSNDSALPAILAEVNASAANFNANEAMAPIIFCPASGAILVEEALDYMVARVAPSDAQNSWLQVPPELAVYAFPWRNFISLARVDPNFTPLNADLRIIWPYLIQDGTAWSNMTGVRNSPIGRLFVDEFANLVFDDSYHAWINDDGSNPVGYIISAHEVLDYDFFINDTNLVTAISVWPATGYMSMAQAHTLDILKGQQIEQLLPGNKTVQASPTAFKTSDIKRYGMRYGQYTSLWDLEVDQAVNRWKYLAVNHNSICFCTLTVRGRPCYRVGMRVTLNVPSHRPEFLGAEWYVAQVSHSGSFGSGWTTHLQLRYPKVNGAIH